VWTAIEVSRPASSRLADDGPHDAVAARRRPAAPRRWAGFELALFTRDAGGWRIDGATAAVYDGEPWTVGYLVVLTENGRTRHVEASNLSPWGARSVALDADDEGAGGSTARRLRSCRVPGRRPRVLGADQRLYRAGWFSWCRLSPRPLRSPSAP
jgi:hypothetical protein